MSARCRPPRLAEWLVAATAPAADRAQMLGDLSETFHSLANRISARHARRWYWSQALWSALPNFVHRIRKHRRRFRRSTSDQYHGDGTMRTLLHDLQQSVRTVRRSPVFALVVILTLAGGIGTNTLIYTIVDGVVLNPFPYPDADRLVGIGSEWPRLGRELGFFETLSPVEYQDVKQQSEALEHVVMWDLGYRTLAAGGDRPEVVFAAFWFDDAFPTLGVEPVLGRGFTREELDRGDPVAIVSERFWRTNLGADPEAIGRTLYVEDRAATLVGIIPAQTSPYGTELWAPMGMRPEQFSRDRRQMQILARLKPGFSLADANTELAAISGRIAQEFGREFEEYAGWRMRALPWTEVNVRGVKTAAFALLAAVAFVLLLVCANVASLLLSRASTRRKEIAVRTALGAPRPRIVRQLLTESVVLSVVGGAIGAVASFLAVRPLAAVLPRGVPADAVFGLNYRVLLFTAAVSVLTGVVFGLVPSLQLTRTDVHGVLKAEGSGTTWNASRHRLQRLFVGVEFAIALILLAVGGLFINSFVRSQQVDPGFDPANTLTLRLTLAASNLTEEQRDTFFPQLVERISGLTGVIAAGAGNQFPPRIFGRRSFAVEGRSYEDEQQLPDAYLTLVTDGYHEALGIPLLQGRTFNAQDVPSSPLVAVINEEAARRYFPAEAAIGRRVKPGGPADDAPWVEVVGIVRSVRNRGLEQDPQPEVFVNLRQIPGASNQLYVVVQTERDPYGVLEPIQSEVSALVPNQSVYAVQSIDDIFREQAAPRRVGTLTVALFAAFALGLAATGIYAVVSHGVNERTREIGLRVALGADERAVRRLVVRQAMGPVTVGGTMGLVAALLIGRQLTDLLFDVSGTDPGTVAAVALLLGGVATAASYLPALRASRLAPTVALRGQ